MHDFLFGKCEYRHVRAGLNFSNINFNPYSTLDHAMQEPQFVFPLAFGKIRNRAEQKKGEKIKENAFTTEGILTS